MTRQHYYTSNVLIDISRVKVVHVPVDIIMIYTILRSDSLC